MTPVRRLPPMLPLAAVALSLLTLGAAPAPVPVASRPVLLLETRPVETLLGNKDVYDAATVWLDAIAGAKKSLDLEHFYLSTWPGEPMQPVIAALAAAAKRGVRVRLILDARMHATYPQPADSLGTLKNLEVRVLDMKQVSGGGVQHAKYFIIDGDQVIVGSQNLDWRSLKHIHELGVRVREPRIATEFARVFESDWAAAAPTGGAKPAGSAAATLASGSPAQPMNPPTLEDMRVDNAARGGAAGPRGIPLVNGPGDTAWVRASFSPIGHAPDGLASDRERIVALIDSAKRDVVVQLLTYGNGRAGDRDTTIDLALRRAAARGVGVRMVVSDWEADSGRLADLEALSGLPNVHIKLSHVPEWSGGYIPFARVEHCKYMVVDLMTTWIGTANWEPDYFHSSRNAAITIENRPIAVDARNIFMASWDALTARMVVPGLAVEKRVHGETPPSGMKTYGK
ncbi:MAG: DUF1669 domain-containing protein [Candidatus Eisenbacteria bacterium]|nr:DUF1669 domain-containing protein [Candidatus Eisenbacteria bacterium]